MTQGPVRILGLGNPLRGDDGVGVAAVERLAAEGLPAGVEAVDVGAGGLVLLGLLEGAAGVVLVDAADLGEPPGTVCRFAAADLVARAPGPSLHGSTLSEVLALAQDLGTLPPLIAVLVQVEATGPGVGLSPAVRAALPALVAAARAAATALGEAAPVPAEARSIRTTV